MNPRQKPHRLGVVIPLAVALTSCGLIGYDLSNPDSQETNIDSGDDTALDSESGSNPPWSTDSGTDTDNETDTASDSDGCPDDDQKTAPGICGCGVPDVDSDGDGTADCLDQCPSDPNKAQEGACGCGVPDADGDSDGTPNCLDEPLILSFDFLADQNDALSSDVIGEVADSRIYLTVPNGTNLAGLVPQIEFSGASVSPSGGTAGDFSDSPVVYNVTDVGNNAREYAVWVFGQSDDFDDNQGFDYSGWTEINFTNGELPLYTEQNGRLEWSRGEVGEEDHVTLNDDSYHSRSVTVSVFASQLDSVGNHHVYFFFQDENNWYRLRRDSGQGGISHFEKRIDGTTTQISAIAPLNLGAWLIEVTDSGTISLFAAGATVLSFSDPLSLDGGLIGLGGASRRPVWDNFKVSK